MAQNPCFDWQKRDFKLTPDEVRPLWEYAKAEYLDRGVSFEDTIHALVMESGAPARFWYEVFAGKKALRWRSNELLRKEYNRREAIDRAKKLVEWGDKTPIGKALFVATELPRMGLTFAHGGVFPVTHGGGLLLTPTRWVQFAKGWATSWKMAPTLGITDPKMLFEAARLKLITDDIHEFARNSGLKVDPNEGPQGILSGWVGRGPGWSRRSWLGLQVMRQELFKKYMARFPADVMDEATYRAVGREMADIANKATGVTNYNIGVLGGAAFAPQLTASKVARVTVDPYKTIGAIIKNPANMVDTFTKMFMGKGGEVTSAERAAAYIRLRYASEFMAATYIGLQLNDALLRASGNNQRINFKDPLKSDWMRFKGGGLVMSSRGPEEIIRLFGRLVAIPYADKGRLQQQFRTASPRAAMTAAVAQFGEYKINPNIQVPTEFLAGQDLFGRPLPEGIQNVRKSFGMQAPEESPLKPQYSGWEYTAQKGPIFIGGAARDMYEDLRERGLPAPDALTLARGALIASGEFAGFGAYRERPEPVKQYKSIRSEMEAEKRKLMGGSPLRDIKKSLQVP